MTRTAWFLAALLVLSNLAWWWSRPANPELPPLSSAGTERTARERELEEQLQDARRALAAAAEARPEQRAPVEPEPTAIRASRAREAEATARRQSQQHQAYTRASELVDAALQTSNAPLRQQALSDLRAWLMSGSADDNLAALQAIPRLRELDYDKASMRALVEPFLAAEDELLRAASLFALYNTVPDPDDVQSVIGMLHDPSMVVRERLAAALPFFAAKDLRGDAGNAVHALLLDDDRHVRRTALNGLWGSQLSPVLEAHLLELAGRQETRHDAIYFGLSTLPEKSPRVVSALVEAAAGTGEEAGRALWGLSYGVEGAEQTVVADAAVDLLESRSSPHAQREYLDLLERYGTAHHAPRLDVFAANPLVVENVRERAIAVATRIRAR